MKVIIGYLDLDGLAGVSRTVLPDEEANALRLYLGDDPSPAVEMDLRVVTPAQIDAVINALRKL